MPGETRVPPWVITGRAVILARQHLINHGCTIPVDVMREALVAATGAAYRADAEPEGFYSEAMHKQLIAEAVGAERERCVQIALSEAAKLRAGDSPEWEAPCAGALEDFADLLRPGVS